MRAILQHKYIHYGHPQIAGLYYRKNRVFYRNLDGLQGKVIVIVPEGKKEKTHE